MRCVFDVSIGGRSGGWGGSGGSGGSVVVEVVVDDLDKSAAW